MEESHHRSIIDHLELGPGNHHLQEDLSKGVLRTIHNVENGTLHFITIPPAANSREQEYIESSLLGADLLSSHLPNGLLVDYISTTPGGSSTPSGQFHQQNTNLLDHHGGGGIQTYTAEDLQTLVDASSLQTTENDRKLFLQFVNKPATQLSHEAPVIVTNPKDIASVTSLSEPTTTPSSNSFLHYHHQDQLLSSTHSNVNNLAGTGNVLATHHNAHHLHHHSQNNSHQIIQNAGQNQQQAQSHLSSIHSMLPDDCSPSKLFHVTSSATSTNIAINTVTSQNCMQIPPLTPIKRIESPKRYLNYQMVQTQAPMDRSVTDAVSSENFLSRNDLLECEPRSDEEEDLDGAGTMLATNSHFANTYLPHKKRLSKKLGDVKIVAHTDQFHRDSVISNEHHSQDVEKTTNASRISEAPKSKTFACQLCSDSFEDQLVFFTHLKGHYEPVALSPTDDGKASDPKKKPKLPRVKHTKKLMKNDKSSRTAADDASNQSPQLVNTPTEPQGRVYQHQVQSQLPSSLISSTDVIVSDDHHQTSTLIVEPDNSGEFSETEDMLEGIRNVVQKVQEAVDTDTNDGLVIGGGAASSTSGRSAINSVEKTWYQAAQTQTQQHLPSSDGNQADMVKTMDFASELDTQEIHINTGSENFVLFLNKGDYHEQGNASGNQPVHHQQQQHSILTDHHQLKINPNHHNAPTSFLLDADQQLQQPITDCDMNIQILGLSPAEMDFNLSTAPHQLSELSGAKLLKDEQKSPNGSDINLDGSEDRNHEFYLSEEEIEDEGVETDELEEASQHYGTNEERLEVEGTDEVYVVSTLPGKKKGRKKLGGELQDTAEEQNATGGKKPGKKFPCAEPDCDKVFNSKTAVRYHELQHKNERPFKCGQCPKNFFTSSALKVHERLHSGEKPYKCDECGRAFRQWGDMKYHQSSIHSNEKTHQCEFCGKKFARRYSLVLHRKIHLNEKNHVCDICNKAFRASSYLQSHRMIHTGEKPYSCTICSKKFRCGGDMKRHLKTHDRSKSGGSSKPSGDGDGDSLPKSAKSGSKKTTSEVIDLTKIKSEGSGKISTIQAPPVVTVLAKDVNHIATGGNSKITVCSSAATPTGGSLVYLTQAAPGDHFRKPEETVLSMDMTRW